MSMHVACCKFYVDLLVLYLFVAVLCLFLLVLSLCGHSAPVFSIFVSVGSLVSFYLPFSVRSFCICL